MSADNWRECPKCESQADTAYAQALLQLEESYGKIPVDEWLKARDEANKLDVSRNTVETHFREDYEFYWADSDTVVATYGGECMDCGFKVSFKYEHPVDLTV